MASSSSSSKDESATKPIDEPVNCLKHYCSTHKILLVGEGDFSFALSLANAFGSAANIIATSFDSMGELAIRYSSCLSNMLGLKKLDCRILIAVDATELTSHPVLESERFDRIVFNFPHVGLDLSERSEQRIWMNQQLLKGFFVNAKELLLENGEIHVTVKTSEPYSKWNVAEIASETGLALKERVEFRIEDYPGYINKRGTGFCPNPPCGFIVKKKLGRKHRHQFALVPLPAMLGKLRFDNRIGGFRRVEEGEGWSTWDDSFNLDDCSTFKFKVGE